MDINLLNYKDNNINYKLFKEFFYKYKKKYRDFIYKKSDEINEDKFKNDTNFLTYYIKKIVDFYFYLDLYDSDDSENNDESDLMINNKIITYVDKINYSLEEFNRDELCKYIKKIIVSIESNIFSSSSEIENLEITVIRLKSLINIKNTTKYLDMVRKNFEIYKNNYNACKKDRNFLGIINEIRLLASNYQCIYEKYQIFKNSFSINDIFKDIEPLINKVCDLFIVLLKEHTTFLKKYC